MPRPSRRRAYSGSSEDEDDGHSRQKRRRTSETIDIEDRLESLITRVGEKSTSSLESNLEGLATVLEADLNNYKHKIIKILCGCIVRMPEKLTVYTTLVGLLNAKNYNAGGEFVEVLVREIKEAMKTNEFENARIMVRFFADLVNCHVVVVSSVLSLFDNFVEVTLEDNIPQVRSDWFVYAVLSSLPWVGRELYEKKDVEFDRLLATVGNYIVKRQKIHTPILRVWSSDDPHPQEEYLDCLWAQIQQLKQNEWVEKQISRPYLAFEGILCEALQHTAPHVMPPVHTEESDYPLPYTIFRMFDYTDVPPEGPVLPGSHAIERYLLEDQLEQIVRSYHVERKDCAAQLLSIPVKSKIPLNYMIVEVVFGQLLYMPRTPYLEIFHGSLLIELCKLQPGSMPQVLAQATELFFERLDTMNVSCIDRLVNWFSYHLSNFQFRWSWEDWSESLQNDILSPKAKFVSEVLLKCMRLCYHQRLVDIVPTDFAPLLPVKPSPRWKYDKEGSGKLPGTMVAHQLMQAIKQKCSPEDTVDILRSCPNPGADGGMEPHFNRLKVEVFTQTLLYLGAKSFSHSFAAIAKFHQVLKALAETEEAQIIMLRSIYDLWKNHQQMLVVLVDKLLKTQIVECSAVANWIFSTDMEQDFTSFYLWEIMHSTIKKMNKHVTKLQKDLEEAKDKLEAAQRRARDGFDYMVDEDTPTEEMVERMEEKLESAQSEQKNLFLIIFQRFIIILTEHLARSEAEGTDYNTHWYKWVIERLQQVFLLHHEQVYRYISTLESLMFTSDIDFHILEVFQQFCALRA